MVEAAESEALAVELADSCGEFLEAWSIIQTHRVAGWLLLTGRRRARLSEAFVEAVQVLDGEVNRLEHAADVERNRAMRDNARKRK